MERKAHNSLNESILRVATRDINKEISSSNIISEKREDTSDVQQGIDDFHDKSELEPHPEASEQALSDSTNPDSHKNIIDPFIEGVFAGVDLNEHTEDSMMDILMEAIEGVFMLKEALGDLPEEPISYNTLMNNASNPDPKSKLTQYFLNMTAPEANEETSSSNIIEAQYKSRFAEIGSGFSPRAGLGTTNPDLLPAAGSSTLGDFGVSKEDSEELKKLAIAHYESGKIGEHDPESLEGQEQIERGKALVNKIREVANQNSDDPASDQRTAIVRRTVDNHIHDHVAAKKYDEDAYMRDAERESGFGVDGMNASRAERMGW